MSWVSGEDMGIAEMDLRRMRFALTDSMAHASVTIARAVAIAQMNFSVRPMLFASSKLHSVGFFASWTPS